jgi:nucleoside-diphosphate-sugar epimerase
MKTTLSEQPPSVSPRVTGLARVLILGHSGFIGTYLEAYYRQNFPGLEILGESWPDLDLTVERDAERLAGSFNLETALVVLAGVKRQLGDNLDTFGGNVKMTVNLCRVLQRHPVKRVVFFSSAAVYGEENHNIRINEETGIAPTSFYGAAKYTAECLLTNVVRSQERSSLLILRPPLIYGPGDASGGYGPSGFIKASRKDETITIWGDGNERREFVFVEDAARIVGELTLREWGGVLNLASGQSYTYMQIVEILAKTLGKEIRTTQRSRSKPQVDHRFLNARVLELLPGFSFTTLKSGIEKTVAAQEMPS